MNNQNTNMLAEHRSPMPPVWFLLLALVGLIEVVAPLVSRSLAAFE